MLFTEVLILCSYNYIKTIHSMCGQHVEIFNVYVGDKCDVTMMLVCLWQMILAKRVFDGRERFLKSACYKVKYSLYRPAQPPRFLGR
jgi:hypothetical protein